MSSVLTTSRSPGVYSAPAPIAARPAFEIRREDIDWRLVGTDELEIEVTIRNSSDRTTPPTHATVRSAVFGAFLPQLPLTVLAVPSIAPRGRVTLTAVVPTAALATADLRDPSGDDAARISNRLAVAHSDEAERRALELQRTMSLDRERARLERERSQSALYDDTWRWLAAVTAARRQREEAIRRMAPKGHFWTGNLHVFVCDVTAERHRTSSVVVRHGMTTVVPFELGDGRPDAYRFRLDGDASHWEPALTRGLDAGTVPFARGQLSDDGFDWVELDGEYMFLAVRPPESALPGRSELHIQRRSSGQFAVVEFDLDPR